MKKVLRVLAICYAAYLALVLLVVTPALNLLPPWLVGKYLGREFHSEIIWFNPFTLSLELRRTELPEHDGSQFFSLDRATVDLSLASIWSGALVFDEIGIEQLYVHVVELPDGNFNFSDMLPPEEPQAPPSEPNGIPPVTIHQLNFNAQQLLYTSKAGQKQSSTGLSDVTISVEGLSTVHEDGKPYSLDASGSGGGSLHWEGTVSIPRSYSEGVLALTNIPLHPLWEFAQEWVEFEPTRGAVSVEGQYRVDWSKGLDYWIKQGEVRLEELVVLPKTPDALPDTGVSLGGLRVSDIALDGPSQRVAVGSVAIDKLAISGWSEGTRVSLANLFAVNLPRDPAQQPAATGNAGEDESGWTAELDTFNLAGSSLRWRSEYTEPALLEVTPIEASASSIRWPLGGDTALKLELTANGQASASVEGSVDLALGEGNLVYKLSGLPLVWFNPNFPTALNAEITDGQLRVEGELALAGFAPTTIGMNGAIKNFAGRMTGAEESLTSWETVRWDKLQVDMQNHTVELGKLSIDNYSGRIHINKDGSINAQNIWRQEVGAQAEEVTETLAEGEPWAVSAPLIRITDSEIDFMDESLPIHFRTVIGDIDGNIKNISSKPGARTRVDIKGSVDGYAPVALTGTAEPLRSPLALDLELTFAGVDMALLSPYSSTYAGYAIERGVLNLDLKYAMADNNLKGNNKIVINQMKLGEKIASDKAVDVPLELALALLTDSKGVIDMEIPVGGNVGDPEFSVGSVVMGALVNLITKAVTSPFTLLAGLVDSEEDLQRVNFKSGSAELSPAAREKLDNLGAALAQRPGLGLVITGRLQLQADRERLQKRILQGELVAAGLPQEEISSKGPEWDKAIEARYQAIAPGETELMVSEQYLKLAQQVPLPDSDLLTLATDRAIAVKTYLVNELGLNPDRAAIAKPDLTAKVNLYSGAELEIDI